MKRTHTHIYIDSDIRWNIMPFQIEKWLIPNTLYNSLICSVRIITMPQLGIKSPWHNGYSIIQFCEALSFPCGAHKWELQTDKEYK